MAAAAITKYSCDEISGNMWEENVAVYITTTGDWYLSKFAKILNVQCEGNGHVAFVSAITGNKIEITATATDTVYLRIVGSTTGY